MNARDKSLSFNKKRKNLKECIFKLKNEATSKQIRDFFWIDKISRRISWMKILFDGFTQLFQNLRNIIDVISSVIFYQNGNIKNYFWT